MKAFTTTLLLLFAAVSLHAQTAMAQGNALQTAAMSEPSRPEQRGAAVAMPWGGQTVTRHGLAETSPGLTEQRPGQTNPAHRNTDLAYGRTNSAHGNANSAHGNTDLAHGQTVGAPMAMQFGAADAAPRREAVKTDSVVRGVRLQRAKGRSQLTFEAHLADIRPTTYQVVVVTPEIVGEGGERVTLPSIGVYGRTPYYYIARSGDNTFQAQSDLQYRGGHQPDTLRYAHTVAYERWMKRASVRMTTTTYECCDPVAQEDVVALGPQVLQEHSREVTYEPFDIKRRTESHVQFVVDKIVIRPELYGNAARLDSLSRAFAALKADTCVRDLTIGVRASASPEATWAHNTWLANNRAAALKRWVSEHFGENIDDVPTEIVIEDWEGLRRQVVAHELPHKAEILRLIDAKMDPDEKLYTIAVRYREQYLYMLRTWFPALRASEIVITYRHSGTREHVREVPEIVGLPEVERLAEDTPTDTIRWFRPWVAVKTNMLFDLLVSPNFEIELPLGRDNRWSIMHEYWTPWWIWKHNSWAYELQTWGLEGRYWYGRRCLPCRPVLTGPFVGVYVAAGQYDIELRSHGDQGEFFSTGVTWGHSWILGRRWNLEFTASAGVVFGPRRHYHGMFSDTHLIWQHNGSIFYAGPTKLKVSLVWLLERPRDWFKKKGGEQ